MLDSACYLLSYIGDVLTALKHTMPDRRAGTPPFDLDISGYGGTDQAENEWAEEAAAEEEDSNAEDSVSKDSIFTDSESREP